MPLPSLILTTDTFNTWFHATNNLISHLGSTNAYILVSSSATPPPSTGNIRVNGTATFLTLVVNTTMNVYSGATINGAVALSNTLSVVGSVTFSNTVSIVRDLALSGDITGAVNITVSQNVNTSILNVGVISSSGNITSTGILTAGRLSTSGNVTATGNVNAANFFATGGFTGSGSGLTSLNAAVLTGTANIAVLPIASNTANGLMTNVTQAFSGSKVFVNAVSIYQTLTVNNTTTVSNALNVTGNVSITGTTTLGEIIEKSTLNGGGATGTITFGVLDTAILYYTGAASGNWIVDVRGNTSILLNDIMSVGDCVTLALMVTQPASGTPFYQTDFRIDNVSRTVRWQNGFAPSVLTASLNAVDIYTFSIVKTASAFSVFGAFTKFA